MDSSTADWHTSSYSDPNGVNCVEVAEGPRVGIRDSQHRHLCEVWVDAAEWIAVLSLAKEDAL
ncbi:DUF397 domain-containing protein [Streptomonospora nanhaiensis]|uniref:DUF397 domain-containing protein n=1 Tax=Streptomonospora nanhaiensis TaxID=1323731 RepID=UPI001C38AAB2|nr:DUF397 domain-containing protein [Streptomonospora nanhaiensis]MBV2366858.1 DUF397 domain-containing protein [Streptomonospora nanhaiensis]MBX9387648.1 DUF397 domain-containing protein [Streptomonospora nanhaiensis]